jgi:serine/threonine protein kinase/lipoprotein NlpI
MADPLSNPSSSVQPVRPVPVHGTTGGPEDRSQPASSKGSRFSSPSGLSLPSQSPTAPTGAQTDNRTDSVLRVEALVAQLTEEMAESWGQGNCTAAEAFLARHPELWKHPESAADLIYEEVCLRREYGQEVTREQILQRFPQWRAQLEILLDCHEILEIASPPSYPVVGESVGDFHLLAKLGQGGHGCVFLAKQTSLADRPVVIKFAPVVGHEHLSLARLQHTHIMPLFSVLEDPKRNLRALCMPYFGGTTLAQLLKALAEQPLHCRTGQDLLRALDEVQVAAGVDLPSRDPARHFLAQASYVQAICWIGACLADALKYAHERGLIHLDVKPSNVLLTADAQPMLLDFHLAHQRIEPGMQEVTWLGGTPTYMSPEQQRALAELEQGRPVTVTVDGRSDLYSLGLLLYEALRGRAPSGLSSSQASVPVSTSRSRSGSPSTSRSVGQGFEPGPEPADSSATARKPDLRRAGEQGEKWEKAADLPALPRLDRCNPQVGTSVADILAKCLAPNPQDRYRDASALATDLWRHLNDLPLRHIANRSFAERWQKWRRRRPQTLTVLAMVLLVLLVALASGVLVVTHFSHQVEEARAAMEEGKRQLREQHYDEAISTLERGLSRVQTLPGSQDLARELDEQLHRARRAHAVQNLHRVADRYRLLYGVDALPRSRQIRRNIVAECQKFWLDRQRILERLRPAESRDDLDSSPVPGPHSQSEPGNENAEQQVRADLLDLAILSAYLQVRYAPRARASARKKALKMLNEAKESFGDSAVFCYERQRHAEALGLTDMARKAAERRAQLTPRTAWEHYALGRALLEGRRLDEANALLNEAVKSEPKGLWPRFYQGICSYRLQRFEDAVLAFTTCAALAPNPAGFLYNRALAYDGWDKPDRALQDYDAALELDPTLGPAALNLGILHAKAKRYAQACADFDRALNNHVDADAVYYNLALVHIQEGRRDIALADLECALKAQPAHEQARRLYEKLKSPG